MDSVSVMISAVSFLLVAIPVVWAAVYGYRLFGGVRHVTCPETMEEAVVEFQATRAIATRFVGGNAVRVRSCSSWPERQNCGQSCVAMVMATPGGCRARALPTSRVRLT